MRVLYLTTMLAAYPGDPQGGAGNTWFEFFLEMSHHAQITVVAPKVQAHCPPQPSKSLRIVRVGPSKPPRSLEDIVLSADAWRLPPLFVNMWKTARTLIRKEDYDIIHAFWALPSGLLCAVLPTDKPKVLTCLGSDIHNWSHKPVAGPLVKYALRRMRLCIGVSDEICSTASALGAMNVKLIPTPINMSQFPCHPEYSEPHSLVFIGRLTKKKGVYVLLDAIDLVKEDIPDIKLYICGGGPEQDHLRTCLLARKLNNHVTIMGPTDRQGIIQTLAKARALVLPSFGEGTPSVILEALCIGRPVVATDTGDIKKLVGPQSGKLIQTPDPTALAEAIASTFDTRYDPKELRERVNDFDLKCIAGQYLHAYEELLHRQLQ